MFLENDLSHIVPLDGEWQFQLADHPPRTIHVPSAWEASLSDKFMEGPAIYRRIFALPALPSSPQRGERWLLECDAISFAAIVRVNGHHAGEHTGMWSRWQVDVTAFLRAGKNTIEIEVWKPGEGRYKLRESLAGFLPDVCNTFGGIWQGIRLRRFEGAAIDGLCVQTDANGVVRVTGRVVGGVVETRHGASLRVGAIHIDDLGLSTPIRVKRDGSFRTTLRVNEHERWSPQTPQTYELAVEIADVRVHRRIGFRDVRANSDMTLLNGIPIHLRGVLDWGWDERRLCPTPSRDEVRDAFARAHSLGFNLSKLCLFVPDETTFDVADEEGMLLWLELPMWLPKVTEVFKALALHEYENILRRVHHHPSIVIVSLGCELDAEADAEFLTQLRILVRHYLPNALLCDNSGSSEAYGGTTHIGDFYDYHFYADLHYFQPLVEHFSRAHQPAKPWIYGEFCDADTMRDWSALTPKPFWAAGPVTMQRDELTWVREHEARLREAGVTDGGAEITRLGRQQATVMRKFIFEQTREQRATGGYVLTGWKDTPIATSGVVDDYGDLKFDPDEWRAFNADLVLVMDRERRRKWTHGGDQPVYRDPCCWWSGEPIEIHIALSNGGATVRGATLRWQLKSQPGDLIAQGDQADIRIGAGDVTELAVMTHCIETDQLTQFELGVQLVVGSECLALNAWPLWVVPRINVDELTASPALLLLLQQGMEDGSVDSRRVVWLQGFDKRFCVYQPFWREAVHVNQMANRNAYANLSWYGIATDFIIDKRRLADTLNVDPDSIKSLWRRFDARAMTWSDYVVDVPIGKGLLRMTTLRFAGGLGHQPNSLETNPMGVWWLSQLLQFD